MHRLGAKLARSADTEEALLGFDLIRYAASGPLATPDDALFLSDTYAPKASEPRVPELVPNARLAAGWFFVAIARGLDPESRGYKEQAAKLEGLTLLATSEKQAWRWIAQEEKLTGRPVNPRLLERGTLAVPSARDRVAWLAARGAIEDLAQLRELGERFPAVKERLRQIERQGYPAAVYRLSQLVAASDKPGLSYRLLLKAAVVGHKPSCRALQWHDSSRSPLAAHAWLRVGGPLRLSGDDRAWRQIAKWLWSKGSKGPGSDESTR